MEIEIKYSERYKTGISIMDRIREAGFKKFQGQISFYENRLENSTVYIIEPTIRCLLTKEFVTDYKYPWQVYREIISRRF